jgi:ABC-type Fe3+-siderophore transport system permease subunit
MLCSGRRKNDYMKLDIRLPIGLLFCILGALLVFYGAISDTDTYARSLGININLWWGVALVVFGGCMLLLARGSFVRKGGR